MRSFLVPMASVESSCAFLFKFLLSILFQLLISKPIEEKEDSLFEAIKYDMMRNYNKTYLANMSFFITFRIDLDRNYSYIATNYYLGLKLTLPIRQFHDWKGWGVWVEDCGQLSSDSCLHQHYYPKKYAQKRDT